jgi:hypothetical protein
VMEAMTHYSRLDQSVRILGLRLTIPLKFLVKMEAELLCRNDVQVGPAGGVVAEVYSPVRADWAALPESDPQPPRWPDLQ